MLLDRRQLIGRLSLLMGGALSAPVASGVLAGCRARAPGEPARVLDAPRRRAVGALAERILPATDTPGALAAGVDRFVDAMLDGYLDEGDRETYLAGLDRLERRAGEKFGAGFADCATAEQEELVAELDRHAFAAEDAEGEIGAAELRVAAQPGTRAQDPDLDEVDRRFFRLHKELTVAGYYTSEVGQTRELRPMPFGEHRADVPLAPGQKAWA
jgi:hypothetical protein